WEVLFALDRLRVTQRRALRLRRLVFADETLVEHLIADALRHAIVWPGFAPRAPLAVKSCSRPFSRSSSARRRPMAKGQVKQGKKNKQKLTTAEKQKKKKEKQAKK